MKTATWICALALLALPGFADASGCSHPGCSTCHPSLKVHFDFNFSIQLQCHAPPLAPWYTYFPGGDMQPTEGSMGMFPNWPSGNAFSQYGMPGAQYGSYNFSAPSYWYSGY